MCFKSHLSPVDVESSQCKLQQTLPQCDHFSSPKVPKNLKPKGSLNHPKKVPVNFLAPLLAYKLTNQLRAKRRSRQNCPTTLEPPWEQITPTQRQVLILDTLKSLIPFQTAATWKIIPVGKWLITMVRFRPLRIGQGSPSKWPFTAYECG